VVPFVIATYVRIPQAKITDPDALAKEACLSKTCSFHCGSKSTDKDPADDSRLAIRWGYDTFDGPPNLIGTNCWYCERAWMQISHLQVDRDREKFKNSKARTEMSIPSSNIGGIVWSRG